MWGREGQEASHRPELLSHRQDGLRTHPSRDCKGWEGTRWGRERSVEAGGRWREEMLSDHLSEEPFNVASTRALPQKGGIMRKRRFREVK